MTASFRHQLVVYVLMMMGAGCASQVPPAGGPPDSEPPEIISTVPGEGDLYFDGDMFVVRFSEYVDRRSFQESVFLSPSAGALRFDWSGTEVRIVPEDTLRGETTFILTVGTDLKDTRNNNLTRSFTLAFSTGGVIDSSSVSGRVHDGSAGGVMIYAYSLPAGAADTLNPATAEPDYLTQTGADGTYRLTNIKYGRYRVIAVRDVFKNLLYNIQTDMFGMPPGDLTLVPGAREYTGLLFTLSTEDTLRPYLTAAKAADGERVIVRFNERPDQTSLREGITVLDTLSGMPLAVLDFSPADTIGREFHLVTAPQDSGVVYRLILGSLSDPVGNRADSAGRTITFNGGAGRDTLPPAVTFNFKGDSTTGIPPHAGLTMTFNRAVDTTELTAGFSLTRAGTVPVRGILVWEGSMMARFESDTPRIPGAWYDVSLAAGSLRDVRGKSVADSTISRRYRIMEEKFLGSIEGTVTPPEGRDSLHAVSTVVVTSRSLSDPSGGVVKVKAGSDGSFKLGQLPAGRYIIFAFLDGNGNGAFDRGSPFPPRYAERFFVYPDTIKIRPGWPVSGLRLDPGN